MNLQYTLLRPAVAPVPQDGRAGGPAGRFLLALVFLGLLLGGCSLGEGPAPTAAPEPEPLEGPPIREGIVTPEETREAARLVREAETLLAEGRAAEALDRAVEVESRLATTQGSSLAIWIRARAARALQDWDDARSAAEQYLEIGPAGSLEVERASILRAEVMRAGGMSGAVEAIFDVPQSPSDVQIVEQIEDLASRWAAEMATTVLRDLTVEAPRHPVVLPVFLGDLAVRRFLSGAQEEALDLANEAMSLSPGPLATEWARGVLEGDVAASTEVAAILGGLLPSAGSPTIRQLAREIRDGVEVALSIEESEFTRPIQFSPMEDASGASGVASAIRALEQDGVLGVIGPLDESLLTEAANARSTPFPILSPTAGMVPEGLTGVYSLTGVDPGASEALAELALTRGVRRVVVFHAATPEMDQATRWFRERFEAGGGSIVRMLGYAPGATQFEAQMTEIRRLGPDGLVLFVRPGDVELVAPQISFYGVDGIEGLTRFGNESWSSGGVLEQVQPRHLNGVLSVASWTDPEAFGPGWNEFVAAYEQHFQRTLRSPTAALGYDATRLLSQAARDAQASPAGALEALERITDFPGATGLLSVTGGRIQRAYTPVRIQDGRLVPLTP